MSDLFHVIEDAHAVLRSKGVYHKKKVYRRGDRLFAGWGSGFIRLGGGDATSCPNVSCESLSLPEHIKIKRGPVGEPILTGISQIREVAQIGRAA